MPDNNEKFCVDIFTPSKQKWMDDYRVKTVSHPKGTYFTLQIEKWQLNAVLKECKSHGTRFRYYEERWARSDNYRDNFFKAVKGPYACRYCRRRLAKKYMVVDHIVPVAQTKKSVRARKILQKKGIYNVNDVRNLAPSCKKCNRRKSAKMGLWLLRGWFGEKRWFYFLYHACYAAICIFIILIILFGLSQIFVFFH